MTNDDGALAFTPALLTKSDKTTLALLCEGLTWQQIADRRGLSKSTVRNRAKTLFKKIGVKSNTQAIIWAHRNGYADHTT